ncbi:hypothetical protein TB2_047131 [Malus domestica]
MFTNVVLLLCFEVSVPVLRTYTNDFIASALVIIALFDSCSERLNSTVMACSYVHGSLHRNREIRAGTAPDSPIKMRLSARFFAKSLSLAATDCFMACNGDWRSSTQILTIG